MAVRAAVMWTLVVGATVTFAQLNLSGFGSAASAAPEPVTVDVKMTPAADSLVGVEITFHTLSHSIHVYRADTLFFGISDDTSWGVGQLGVMLPKPVPYRNIDGSMVDVIVDGQRVLLTRTKRDSAWGFVATLQFQACDSTKCFPPRRRSFRMSSAGADSVWDPDQGGAFVAASGDWATLAGKFDVAGKAAGYLDAGAFSRFLDDPASVSAAGSLAGKSLWLIIALVLIGGLALNLTPCVLPIIPITLAVIGAGSQAGSRRRGFLVGGVYGLGMALSYGVLGVIVATTGAQFGVINSSPAFNLIIAAVFVVLALAMFDVLQIDFTRFRSAIRHNEKRRGNLLAAFVMGVVAAVLAGACVAPVVISVVLYASRLYADGQAAGLLLPFLLGAGMALPWPLAGAGMSVLPKPGKWMTWVKYVFGVMILVIAAFYAYEGVKLLAAPKSAAVAETPAGVGPAWRRSLAQGLAESRASDRPVLVDFWASWCKNCLVMDASTLKNPSVQTRLANFVLVKYQAENPRDKEIKAVLDRFGVVGLPTYVVLKPKSP